MNYLETDLFFLKEKKDLDTSLNPNNICFLLLNKFKINKKQIDYNNNTKDYSYQNLLVLLSPSDFSAINYFYKSDLYKKYDLMPIIRGNEIKDLYNFINSTNYKNYIIDEKETVYHKIFVFMNLSTNERKQEYVVFNNLDNLELLFNDFAKNGFILSNIFSLEDIITLNKELDNYLKKEKYFTEKQIIISDRDFYPENINVAIEDILENYDAENRIFNTMNEILESSLSNEKKNFLLINHKNFVNDFANKINENNQSLETHIFETISYLSNGRISNEDIIDLVSYVHAIRDFHKEFTSLNEYFNKTIDTYIKL